MTPSRRPSELAVLLLATEHEPPRQRARDQRADQIGLELRKEVLRGFAELDPEPDEESLLDASERIVAGCSSPGSARACASMFLEEWRQAAANPGLWEYLLALAIRESNQP